MKILKHNPRGLQLSDAAIYVGCGPTKFRTMVRDGRMPRPRLIGNRQVFDTQELDEKFEELPRLEATNDDRNDWDD
ncbi:hypothetical protein BEN30_11975 [Magnetovibrio blakemorei]|uniref:Helix-turn-helix domain-containing protein n=1 Tax=Magnetovibrio blakemorei TaxID=28181 RepID=A0A1E5Q6K6_9PROT|nr:hypothetical protein BEN30_11975 [Magnetovibrio blakemorei]